MLAGDATRLMVMGDANRQQFFPNRFARGTAMKADHVSHVNVLYAPEAAKPLLADLRATPTDNPDLPYRIDVTNHVRNREGYKSQLMLDIAALRRNKCIIDFIPNDAAKALIAKGELDPKTLQAIKKTAPQTSGKSRQAAVA